jgi:hypothetical protein
MRVTLLLSAFSALVIAMLSLGAASHSQEVRAQAKEHVALVEYKVLGYEPLR